MTHAFLANLFSLSLLFTGGGCIQFYTYQTTHIVTVDAETGARISGVHVSPYLFLGWTLRHVVLNPPQNTSVVTDANGEAFAHTAKFGRLHWYAEVDGYQRRREDPPPGTYPSELVLHLYRNPAPFVRIIVPHNYRGPVMIHWRKVPTFVEESVGKRNFEFRCSTDGYVAIEATQMLWENRLVEICDEDGTRYAEYQSFGPDTVLAWFIGWPLYEKPSEHKELYVIGTATDESAIRERVHRPLPGERNCVYQDEAATDLLFRELSPAPVRRLNSGT